MSRADLQVNFRMPADLRDALEESAASHRRSLSAEIVARLQSSFDLESLADPSKAPGFVITLDARGWPVSWSEIMAYVGLVQKHGHIEPRTVQVNVLTPSLADSTERDPNYAAIEDNLIRFYERQRQDREKAPLAQQEGAEEFPAEVRVKDSAGKLNKVTVKRLRPRDNKAGEAVTNEHGPLEPQLAIHDRLALIKALEATLPEDIVSHRVARYSAKRIPRSRPKKTSPEGGSKG